MFHVKQNIKLIESIKKFKIEFLRSAIYITIAVFIMICMAWQ